MLGEICIPKEKLVEYHALGLDIDTVAAIFGCHPQTIKNRVTSYGLDIYKIRTNKRKEVDKNRLKTLYVDRELSCGEVARVLGVSKTLVTDRLLELKIPIRPQSYYYQKWREYGGWENYRNYKREKVCIEV